MVKYSIIGPFSDGPPHSHAAQRDNSEAISAVRKKWFRLADENRSLNAEPARQERISETEHREREEWAMA